MADTSAEVSHHTLAGFVNDTTFSSWVDVQISLLLVGEWGLLLLLPLSTTLKKVELLIDGGVQSYCPATRCLSGLWLQSPWLCN